MTRMALAASELSFSSFKSNVAASVSQMTTPRRTPWSARKRASTARKRLTIALTSFGSARFGTPPAKRLAEFRHALLWSRATATRLAIVLSALCRKDRHADALGYLVIEKRFSARYAHSQVDDDERLASTCLPTNERNSVERNESLDEHGRRLWRASPSKDQPSRRSAAVGCRPLSCPKPSRSSINSRAVSSPSARSLRLVSPRVVEVRARLGHAAAQAAGQ